MNANYEKNSLVIVPELHTIPVTYIAIKETVEKLLANDFILDQVIQ